MSPIVPQADLSREYRAVYRQAKRNALRRDIPFTLTQGQFDELVHLSNGRCMISGIPFETTRLSDCTRRPFMPSLDRIKSQQGYTFSNCRLVCILMNIAMNEWGLDPLLRVAHALVEREQEIGRERMEASPDKVHMALAGLARLLSDGMTF